MSILLGVNIDHVATLRQARGECYPNVVEAAYLAEKSGADSITVHLREDRRHIQDKDITDLAQSITRKLNLEMAATSEMVGIACSVKPQDCCLVPEKRVELTTEGGLDVAAQLSKMSDVCRVLKRAGIRVSFFIDADVRQIDAAHKSGADMIELHTGHYANLKGQRRQKELQNIAEAAAYAHHLGLQVNAGHGLTLANTKKIAKIPEIAELNIGHFIISRAVFVGLAQAVSEMKQLMVSARGSLSK